MKTRLQRNIHKIILCLAQIVIAVLLLINPDAFTAGIIVAISIFGVAQGIVHIIRYLRMAPIEAARQQLLSKGLGLIIVGLFAMFRSSWFIGIFPLLAVLYGVVILAVAVMRVQWSVDMMRIGNPAWKFMGAGALISLAMGVVIVLHPFATVSVLWSFVAVTLLISAVMDMVNILLDLRQ